MKKTLLLSFSALVALAVNSQQLITSNASTRGVSENTAKHSSTKGEKALTSTLVCNTPYVVGTTMDLNFTFTSNNTGGESVANFSLVFPSGITPNTSVNNTNPFMPNTATGPAALNAISGQTISWTSPDQTWGGITGANGPISFKVNVTIAPGTNGNKTATYTATGDGYSNASGLNGAGTVSTGNVTILDDAIAIYNASAIYTLVNADFQYPDGSGYTQNCGLTEVPVATRIVNKGNRSISAFSVSYQVNSDAPVTETVAGPIAKGDSLTYIFTKKIATPQGFYALVSYTDLTSDVDKTNDTTGAIAFANSLPTVLSTTTYTNGFENDYEKASVKYDWKGSGAPFGISTSTKHSGTTALFFTASLPSYPAATYSTYAVLPCMEVVAGAEYVISFWKKANSKTAPLVVNGETAILSGKTNDFRLMDTIKPFSAITPNAQADVWTKDSLIYVAKETGTRYFAIGGRGTVSGTVSAGAQNTGNQGNVRLDDITVRQSKVSGINELAVSSFSVYPNPANDLVTVSLSNNASNGTIVLMSTDGKVIESREYTNSTKETFDVKALTSGVYFFKVGNTTQKVIIK